LTIAPQFTSGQVKPEASEADLPAVHRISPQTESAPSTFKILKQRP
jgi:hypothetical protein